MKIPFPNFGGFWSAVLYYRAFIVYNPSITPIFTLRVLNFGLARGICMKIHRLSSEVFGLLYRIRSS